MPTFSLATLGVDPRQTGLASALITAAQQLGGGVGAALLNRVATPSSFSSSARDTSFPALVDGHLWPL
jgi:predicted MFS family arabinose efflux permease